jgi:DMSO/TMAO reductase YedYZ molybdopterin-dependent catalytic subunit
VSQPALEALPERRHVLSEDPPNAEAGEQAFASLLTPAGLRFVRCHHPVPRVGPEHDVEICGAVVRPRRLGLAELRALTPLTLSVVTECAGNGRALLEPGVDGEQWRSGAVSAAQWTGVPLAQVLELKDTALEVVCTGTDREYQRSLPREVAMDPATLLAWEMNGEPVPAVFGGPLRLVVPGWYGMASVKWVARIEAVEDPFRGLYQTEKYLYRPGDPVTRIRIKSMFGEVREELRAGRPARIGGLAWGGQGVASVSVWIDRRWHKARLLGPALPYAFRRFEIDWTPPAPGRYLLRCRATDARGETQPARPRWNPQGYGANGVQQIEVRVQSRPP